MSIPTTLLIMASSASTATPVPSSTSSTKLEFIGTEIDGQDGVHRTAATSGNAVAIVGEVQATGLPNPWADIWPGSISTNPTPSNRNQQYTPSSATIGILCVAIVFGAVLIAVVVWQLKERRDSKKEEKRLAEQAPDVEKSGGSEGGNWMMGADGKMVQLGNAVVVAAVLGERSLRIL